MKNNSFLDMFDRVVRESRKSRPARHTESPMRRVRLWLNTLEERTVPAAVPILPATLVSDAGVLNQSAGYSPQVAINPLNSQWIVEVHATATGPQGNFSLDGGGTWISVPFPTQPNLAGGTAVYDPNIYQGTAQFKTPFAVTESPSIAFDKQGNFYVISSQHDATNQNGAIIFQKFDMTTGFPFDAGTQRLYAWRGQDQAYNPVVAVNTNAASYTDPQSGAVTTDTLADQAFLGNTQLTAVAVTDLATTINVLSAANLPVVPFFVQVDNEQMKVTNVTGTTLTVVRGFNGTTAATHIASATVATLSAVPKGVFVAWNVNTTQFPNAGLATTVSRIVTMVSPDGGNSFTTQQRVSADTVDFQASNPKIVFSQAGGQLNYFYDYNVFVAPPLPFLPNGVAIDSSRPDGGVTNAAVAATQTFSRAGGNIDDAEASSNGGITTQLNGAINPGVNFLFVDFNAGYLTNSGPFQASDRFQITNPTVEDFRIQQIITGSTLAVAVPGTLAVAPALDVISVASSAAFLVGDLIQIDAGTPSSETMRVNAISGNSLTVTRAVAGTLSPHAVNAIVTNILRTRWNVVGGENSTTPAAHPDNSVVTKLAATASQPKITIFTQNVLIDAANLITIKDLDVALSIVHPNLSHLSIVLIPPPGSGLGNITLVQNRLDANGEPINGFGGTPRGITGQNLGTIELGASPFIDYNSVGTVFNSSADRPIVATNAAAPYIGYFRPESGGFGGGLNSVNGLTNEQLSGDWTLVITDFVNDTTTPPFPTQFVQNWTLNFTGVIDTNGFGQDADTGVVIGLLPSVTNVYPTTNTATGTPGIGQGVSIAVDNTLGGFSPYQGRMYMVYNTGGTGVAIVTSDDNGQSWSSPVQVDDDDVSDNFTEGNRPQFTPTVTVDPVTGTVVVSYFDARNDAAGARVATAIVTSIDGGKTFSKVAYANPTKTAIDFLTGKTINVETIPGNQRLAGTLGFGDRQGLVAYGGNIIPVFASNANSGGSSIFTAKVTTAAGPRVIYGDSGSVTHAFTSDVITGIVSYNNTFAADGTRLLDGFVVQFDRPVDITSFTASDVVVQFKDAVTGAISVIALDAAQGVVPLDMPQSAFSGFGPNRVGVGSLATQFFIKLAVPQGRPGTYSYAIGNAVYDRNRAANSPVTLIATPPAYAAPFTNAVAVPTVDFAPVTSVIAGVPALPVGQVIAGVTVTVNIAHAAASQLDLYLISPRGTRILLSNQNGGVGANYTATIFDDVAANSIVSGTAPFTGTFKPEQVLAQLIGQDPAGDWTLEVTDLVAGTTGAINSWSLNILVGTNINGNAMDQNANGFAGEAIAYLPGGNVSTLTATVAETDTAITLASVAGFPVAPFVVQVNAEQMLVTGVSGNTLTVIRAYNGTLPTSHLAADTVAQLVLLNASTLLDADLGRTATILVVPVPLTSFPVAPFVVQIGTEQLRVTADNGFGIWTVIRGFNGTDAAQHIAGDVIVSVNAPDVYSNPSPRGSAGATIVGVPFASPFNSQTLPLIIPGLHVQRTSAPNASGAYVSNSLVATTVAALGLIAGTLPISETSTTLTTGTTLAVNILAAPPNTAQTITVTATIAPGLTLPFIANIGAERIRVTAIAGDQWSVVRGIAGTAATAQFAGAPVTYTLALSSSTTLNANIAARASNTPDILTVASTTAPTVALPFFANIGAETIQVTAINGNQWSVLRGVSGTTAVARLAGTAITFNVPIGANLPLLVRVGNEVMRVTAIAGANLTVLRGLENTLAVPHLVDSIVTAIGGIDSTATEIRVASSVGFPTTPRTNPFTIQIGGEMLAVTAIDLTNSIWTVIRGVNGTTIPDEHANGAVITLVPAASLALNRTTNSIDITFDRAVNPASFDATDILSINGPLGAITGTFTVTANPAGTPASLTNRVFRIGFPTQTLSGNYNVVLAPTINDTAGNAVDSNLNAGLDLLRGVADPLTTTIERKVYPASPALAIRANTTVSTQISIADVFNIVQSTSQLSFTGPITTSINQALPVLADPAQTTLIVLSNLGFPSTATTGVPFVVQIDAEQIQVIDNTTTTWTIVRGFNGTTVASHANGAQIRLGEPNTIQVLLNITHGNVPDLSVTLTSPDGKVINLFANSAGRFGTKADLFNTRFDDSAITPIQNAPSPIPSGPFNPQSPLSVLNGSGSAGLWTLSIRNRGNTTGTLTNWELRLPKTVPTNGLGEPVADRITATFRIFTFASTNPQSSDQWTPVGPVGNTLDSATNGDNGGPVDSVTVDPSDPSGNTVYAGAATGGIWKTTNFLTQDPSGPNWLPLTDFGPGNSLNIGSIAVFPRNNDPAQTIIIAGTGNSGIVTQIGNPITPNTFNTTGGPGVGFIRSLDGGRTWQLLDSTTNVDGLGNILAFNSGLRDRAFVGTSGFKVLFDPTPLPGGGVLVYAALAGTNGGVYRSFNAGNTWQLIRGGNATDLSLAAASRNNNGNLTILYAAFRGQGVYRSNGDAPNTTGMTLLVGGVNPITPRLDLDQPTTPQIPTIAPVSTPSGNKGNIVLAAPSLSNTPLADTFYQGWLFAAVATQTGNFDGLYVTKDFGFNWTNITLPLAPVPFFGTNNDRRGPNFDLNPLAGAQLVGNYALTLTVDPNNPNIVYLGGAGGVYRVDITKIDDPYTLDAYINDDADGGLAETATAGATRLTAQGDPYGIDIFKDITDVRNGYFNLYRNPNDPFVSPSSLGYRNVFAFRNSGTEITWMPFALTGSRNYHQIVAVKDPLSGGTRLLFANDSGLQVGVDDGTGNYITNIGASVLSTGYRNGNMQTAQIVSGSAQPSALAAALAGSIFYGSSTTIFDLKANPNIISTGDLRWSGTSSNGSIVSSTSVALGRVTGAAGVGADQTGNGTFYQFQYPSNLNLPAFLPTDFFQFTPAGQAAISRVSGLVQGGDNPNVLVNTGQWPSYQGSNFAVNPVDSTGLIIASQQGRIFRSAGPTLGSGVQWFQTVATGQTGAAPALAFGSLNTVNNTRNDFFYAGYESGSLFVTVNGGSSWTNLSAGLDGSGVSQIVTNPTPGSKEAYAVTENGVYWMKDSSVIGASWVKINDNTGQVTTLNATINAVVTTLTVASRVGFPTAPFVVTLGTEQVLVTAATSNTWTIQRGYNNTTPVAHTGGGVTAVTQFNPLFGLTNKIFNVNGDIATTLKYLTSIQADWRYAIPDPVVTTTLVGNITATATSLTVFSNVGIPPTPFIVTIGTEQLRVTNATTTTWTVVRGVNNTQATAKSNLAIITPTGGTHPVLYVGGSGGVFRSRDKGQTWQFFPNVATDGAVQDGGLLPNVNVSALNLALGNINPQTGYADPSSGYNLLLASTFGRGDFAIRLDNSSISQFIAVPNSGPIITNFNPIVTVNGSQFNGFTINFGGAVDPTSFTASDITVTGPNGPVLLSTAAPVVDLIGAVPNNRYQINFATPQIVAGNYIVNIGPDVLDYSGNKMDQNSNNVNGEAADKYVNTFKFTSNTPPTISSIATQTLLPGTSSAPIAFTIGDKESPAASLSLTPTPFVSALPGFTGTPPTLTIGGTGASRTVTVNSLAGSHGSATVTITVQDANGLQTATSFTVNVDSPPVLPAISAVTVNHGTTPVTINLNATDPDFDPLTFSVAFTDPLFAIKQQFGFTPTSELTQFFNNFGNGERYLIGTGGINYLLLPDGKLYLRSGNTAGALIANVGLTVYANPDLLLTTTGTPLVSISNPLYDLKVKYGIIQNYFLTANTGEKYLTSTNGSGEFLLTTSNTLITRYTRQLVADFTALGYGNVYANPGLLANAKLLTADAISAATVSNPGPGAGGSVTLIPNPAFVGTVGVTVTATGLALSTSRTFNFTVNDVAPTIPVVAPQSTGHNTPLNLSLPITDSDPDAGTRTFNVDFSNPLFDIKAQYGLIRAFGAADPNRGGAKFSQSTNGNNAAGGFWFYLLPDNKLYFNGSNAVAQDFAGLGDVYNNPALLTGSSPVPPTAFLNRGPLYDLKLQYGINSAPARTNQAAPFETYYASANGGFIAVVPNAGFTDATLVPWNGVSVATSLASPSARSIGIDAYFSPSLLFNAQPVFVGDSLFALREQYGFFYPEAFFNAGGQSEKYMYAAIATPGAPVGFNFFIKPDGFLYRRTTANGVGVAIANVGVAVYNNPGLLYNATGQALPVTTTGSAIAGNNLNLVLTPNAAFTGTVRVKVTISDGALSSSQSFLYTVTNTAPTATTPIASPVNATSASGGTVVSLAPPIFNDVDTLSYLVSIKDPLFDLRTKYGLNSPATAITPSRDNARFLLSNNRSSPLGSNYFVIKPVAGQYQLLASDGSSSGGTVVFADVGLAVYNNPALLTSATTPAALAGVTSSIAGTNLSIAWPTTYVGTFLVDVFANDGAASTKQSFLVKVS